MGISLRSLTDKNSFTMREVAQDRGFEYFPISQRELVTPQLAFDHSAFPSDGASDPDTRPGSRSGEASDSGPGSKSGIASKAGVRWTNWLGDHAEDNTTRLEPENKTQLRQAMVNMLDLDGAKAEVRSVGAGHSHSKAAEPSSTFVDLRRLRNTNGTLSHGPGQDGYLHVDQDKSDGNTTYVRAPYAHTGPDGVVDRSNLARLKGGTMLKRLNRDILPNVGPTGGNAPGKALINMGAWDGQTIAGAINTGTHGTGVKLGAVSDAVRSVEIATVPESKSGVPIVQLYRIEPENGITDREAFEADAGTHEMQLIQDDDVFHSVVVGYGCMGNVFHYTLEVRDAYWLEEVPTVRRLESRYDGFPDVKISTRDYGVVDDLETDRERTPLKNEFLTKSPQTGNQTRHLRLLVNLAATQGEPSRVDPEDPICLELRRREVPAKAKPSNWDSEADDTRWPPERPDTPFEDFIKNNYNVPHPLGDGARKRGNWAKTLRNRFFRGRTTGSPPSGEGVFETGRWSTTSYKALRRKRDDGNYPPAPPRDAISTAVAVPLDQLAPAIRKVIDMVQTIKQTQPFDPNRTREKDWKVFFPVPMGIRFVAGTHHHLSPEFDDAADPRPRAMLELPIPVVDFGRQPRIGNKDYPKLSKADVRDRIAKPALAKIEQELVNNYEGRPHMGKHFTLHRFDLTDLYPKFEGEGSWMESYRRFNAFGTFNNAFTDQLGININYGTVSAPTRLPAPDIDPKALPEQDTGSDSAGSDSTGSGGDSSSGPADGIGASGPGFSVVGGLTGLGIGAWLAHRLGNTDPKAIPAEDSSDTSAVESEGADDES